MKALLEDFEKLQTRYRRLETVAREPWKLPAAHQKSEKVDPAKGDSEALVPIALKRKFICKDIQSCLKGRIYLNASDGRHLARGILRSFFKNARKRDPNAAKEVGLVWSVGPAFSLLDTGVSR